MKVAATVFLAALLTSVALAPAASADFGFEALEVRIEDEAGLASLEAGSHPFGVRTHLALNSEEAGELGRIPSGGQARNLSGSFPPGLIGNPLATPRCPGLDFATIVRNEPSLPACSDSSVVGLATVAAAAPLTISTFSTPVYNLVPPPGAVAKFGFMILGQPVTIEATLKETYPYNVQFSVSNITQMVRFYRSDLTLWGNPSDHSHDRDRAVCGATWFVGDPPEYGGPLVPEDQKCETTNPDIPFLTLPRECGDPLAFEFLLEAWNSAATDARTVYTHEGPTPLGVTGCEALGFTPQFSARPTGAEASSPTGLDIETPIEDEGLDSPAGRANSDIKKALLTLPEGVTINPSQAEGLQVCGEADLARESATSAFGAGCPAGSKIGTVEAETPLFKGTVFKGSLFVAEPYANRFGSLIAVYIVFKEPLLGVGVKLAAKVEPDPRTGQLVSTLEQIPPVPVSDFRLHFREGARSPLIAPPRCGPYTSTLQLTPSAEPSQALPLTSTFQITAGPGGGPCPPAGAPPFEPGFSAGSLNNAAAAYSPFQVRLQRRDGDQDLTRFSSTLPLGLTAKLAGVGRCTDAEIAQAKAKSGKAELASPSCPADSRIGSVQAGAGVGSQLTYVPGSLYLAAPYNGAPLSVVAIVPAVAGPFDVGTVVTRFALDIDPRSAEVRVDGDRSDPIPHILAGIPLAVRDVRAKVERPGFTLNPTSCDPKQSLASIWGGGENPFSTLDDSPVARSARYQAAGCRGLGFKPRLALRLKGGTRRGAHPSLRGVFRPRPGQANAQRLVVRLPRSAFLEQAHIRTICTRVQFAAGPGHGARCPKGSVYGHVTAYTPLLSEALKGPVYLRSSSHNLPDLVLTLHSSIGVDFEAVGRIDSKRGGIRTTFTKIPDAPLSRVILRMQGAKKGLIVNSTNLCKGRHRADARLLAHNGARRTLRPALAPSGCKKAKRRRHRRPRRG